MTQVTEDKLRSTRKDISAAGDVIGSSGTTQKDCGTTEKPKKKDNKNEAAQMIQRHYRGYRTRRQLKGFSLDPSTRWMEAIKEAQWQQSMEVQRVSDCELLSRDRSPEREQSEQSPDGGTNSTPLVREKWRRVGQVALRAGGDDNIGDKLEGNGPSVDDQYSQSSLPRESRISAVMRRTAGKPPSADTMEVEKTAKMMDLQYFLEMVDSKHRYGSNLRAYHNYWKNSSSNQNFFYWLDYGEGKDVEVDRCSRERLEREQVRYLTREERMDYLVTVDEQGRFRWAKNGERVWTDSERYRDSIRGVVLIEDKSTPTFREHAQDGRELTDSPISSDGDDDEDFSSEDGAQQYMSPDSDQAKGVKKVAYVSPAVIFNQLVRKSMKKKDKWIFVADTSYRIYVGIKDSGAFQHSSFLRGARISAAGLIRIKDGQLRSLSPLSGHYRPPAASFRSFVHSLQKNGVDMSHVSISRSYAVLIGIEGYMKSKRKVKNVREKVDEGKAKIVEELPITKGDDGNDNEEDHDNEEDQDDTRDVPNSGPPTIDGQHMTS